MRHVGIEFDSDHAADSSNFRMRLKHKSRKVLSCPKSLILAGLRRGRGPHCSFYNGSPRRFIRNARAVSLAVCALVDMPPDIAICRQQFIGNLHITLGIVFLVSLCDFKAYVV